MDNIKDILAGLAGNEEVKAKVAEIIKQVGSNRSLADNFKADPEKAFESLTGIDIPDEIADKVLAGVKTAMAKKDLSNIDLSDVDLGDILGKAKDLIGGDK